ncbi:hypothetical protein ABNQ38_29460 [Azospirillum sp. A29]|uniref:hypothetical protein n=1 Tax=Azospirillum sp. A29 TaxID=3160606 RepID=UPI00367143F5
MSFLIPIRIAPIEETVIDASAPSERVRIVMQACAGEPPGHQKRLITSLYEAGALYADEAISLIARLGLVARHLHSHHNHAGQQHRAPFLLGQG